jgi:hypothetical protein
MAEDTLTEDERRELESLRAEREDAKAKAEAEKAKEDAPLPDTHWLNLADGTTITAQGVASHVGGIPVLHATAIPAELLDGGDPNAEPAHRF